MKSITRIALFTLFVALSSNTAIQAWPSWQSIKQSATKYKDNIIGATAFAASAYTLKQCIEAIKDYLTDIKILSLNANLKNTLRTAQITEETANAVCNKILEKYSDHFAKYGFDSLPFITREGGKGLMLVTLGTIISACCLLPALKMMLFGKSKKEENSIIPESTLISEDQ